MKTRYALVSNSSSSNFIVHRTIGYTATKMWKCNVTDWDIDEKKISIYLKEIIKACKRQDVLSGKVGICFPSMGEDTYIVYKDKVCYVTTCSNYRWTEFVDGIGISSEDNELIQKKVNIVKFFYYISAKKLLTKKQFKIPRNLCKKLVCKECNQDSSEHGLTDINADYYFKDEKDNKYCYLHCKKLQEV
jgi:hypothetical protein